MIIRTQRFECSQAGSLNSGGGGGGGTVTGVEDQSGTITTSAVVQFLVDGTTGISTIANDGPTPNTLTYSVASSNGANIGIGTVFSSGTGYNIALGPNTFPASFTGYYNIAIGGRDAGSATTLGNLTSGQGNTALGYGALSSVTSDNSCIGIGQYALQNLSGSTGNNCSIGNASGYAFTTGQRNTTAGNNITNPSNSITGSNNTFLGYNSAASYNAGESNNILLNSTGVLGESNVLRICDAANTSTGTGLSAAYIGGISGVNVGSTAQVVTMGTGGTADKLGTSVLTAGTGISITPGANAITISSSGTTNLTYTNVNHAASPYTVLATDEYLSVDCSGGTVILLFPNAATSGRTYVIKDRTGSAATNNITIESVSGGVNIDGATTFVMNTNYESVSIMGNSTSYEVW